MGWLAFCQRNWPTLPWNPEGCRLRPFTKEEIEALGDVDGAESEPGDGFPKNWKYWQGSRQVTALRGVNPHGIGKLHVDRNAIVKDVPFWATKWLVFERDKKCQDCGAYGWESDTKPLTQADVDAHNAEMNEYSKQFSRKSTIKDWYHYATPDYSKGLEVHHIVAVTDGGSNCTENTMLLCWRCHQRRGGKGGLPASRETAKLVP